MPPHRTAPHGQVPTNTPLLLITLPPPRAALLQRTTLSWPRVDARLRVIAYQRQLIDFHIKEASASQLARCSTRSREHTVIVTMPNSNDQCYRPGLHRSSFKAYRSFRYKGYQRYRATSFQNCQKNCQSCQATTARSRHITLICKPMDHPLPLCIKTIRLIFTNLNMAQAVSIHSRSHSSKKGR